MVMVYFVRVHNFLAWLTRSISTCHHKGVTQGYAGYLDVTCSRSPQLEIWFGAIDPSLQTVLRMSKPARQGQNKHSEKGGVLDNQRSLNPT